MMIFWLVLKLQISSRVMIFLRILDFFFFFLLLKIVFLHGEII
jgi:hypothetical protein